MMHLRAFIRRGTLVASLAALFVVPSVHAQQATTTGSVRGVVTSADASGIPNVAVVAVNEASGTRRGVQTDDRGRYSIPFLDPGVYTIRAQRIGFRPAAYTGLRISLGQIATQDIRLEAAAAQLEAVAVSASSAALIEGTKTGTNTRILEEQLRQLPTSDRNFKNLVVLTPGASDVGATGAGGGQSIGGGRTASYNLLMDGVNNN